MRRCCVIVLDGCGIGALPDASDYGDSDADTLAHVAEAVHGLRLPHLQALGLGNASDLRGCAPEPTAPALLARLEERSVGKDSTTGHWELMGVLTRDPLPLYPEGFPLEVVDKFAARTGRVVLGNTAASGTEIIQELGGLHQRTGDWIVYTSADSVFMVAAHEETVPLDELYAACRIAREEILIGGHQVGRVIARPFVGAPGSYVRTAARRDYSIPPPRPTYLTLLGECGARVLGVGKIHDLFAGYDIESSVTTKSNQDGIDATCAALSAREAEVVFTNLVETDMLWGHRNDPARFHECLREFDERLPEILDLLDDDDLLIVTSDHGVDPTLPSPYHTREYAFALVYSPSVSAGGRVVTGEFADVGATAYSWVAGRAADGRLPGRPLLTEPSTP